MTDSIRPMEDSRGPAVFTALKVNGRPLPVVLHERDGRRLFVRELDPGETLQPIRFDPAVDTIVPMKTVSATRLCFGPEEGGDDAMTHDMRVVPDGREGSTVYMRTLRHGESDDGRRVHLKPGERPAFRAGSLKIELDALDAHFTSDIEGFAPLANTVWTWLKLAGQKWDVPRVRYVLAAARRLDAAAATWSRVTDLFSSLEAAPEASLSPQTRALVFELIAGVELAVIALRRVVAMVECASSEVGADTPVPDVVERLSPHLTEIRNAFEHIDERASDRVRRKPDPVAASVFEQRRLLTERVIVYADHEIGADDVTELLASCRQFLKDVVRSA